MKKCIFVVLVSSVLGFANQGETMQVIEKAGSLGSFKGDSKIFSGDVQVYMMFKANVFRDFSGALVEHFHGATDSMHGSHIALTGEIDGKNAKWHQKVSDIEYKEALKEARE